MDKIEELKAEQAKIAAELALEVAKMEGKSQGEQPINNQEEVPSPLNITPKTDRKGRTAQQRVLERGPLDKSLHFETVDDWESWEALQVVLESRNIHRHVYNSKYGIKKEWWDFPSHGDAKDMNQEQYEALLVEWQGPYTLPDSGEEYESLRTDGSGQPYPRMTPVPVKPVPLVPSISVEVPKPFNSPFNGPSMTKEKLDRWEQLHLDKLRKGID